MLRLAWVLALLAGIVSAAPVTITGTIRKSDNSLANGSATIELYTPCIGASGNLILAQAITVSFTSGNFSVGLEPTTTCAQTTYYRVRYRIDRTWSSNFEYWAVPPSPNPTTIAAVRRAEAAPPLFAKVTSKGDLSVFDGVTFQRQPICADNEVLKSDGTGATGWKCGTAAGTGNEAQAPSAFTTNGRAVTAAGANRNLIETPLTINASTGDVVTPGKITAGSGDFAAGGNCVTAGSVAPPASGLTFFCNSGDSNRLWVKDSTGATASYLKVGEASGGGNSPGSWSGSPSWSAIPDFGCDFRTFAATGLAVGTVLTVVPPVALGAVAVAAKASAADTALVTVCNSTGASVTPSGSFTVLGLRGYTLSTATLDFPVMCDLCSSALTATLTGATTSMSVMVSAPAAFASAVHVSARITAADTITVMALNMSGASVDPASGSFNLALIQ